MKLGLQRTSLIDFPGMVSCVVFMPGCDLACPFCHNPELAKPGDHPGFLDSLLDEEDVLGFLEKRKGVLGGVVFSGGEPCLNPSLGDLIIEARGLSYAVKVDTNGMHPDVLATLDADFVSMDLKTSPKRYAERIPGSPADAEERLLSCLGILRSRGLPHEVRTTLAPGFADLSDIDDMSEAIERDESWMLQRFRPGKALETAYAEAEPYGEEKIKELLARARSSHAKTNLR
jgi:pyruvate formate lyase activating enzyme